MIDAGSPDHRRAREILKRVLQRAESGSIQWEASEDRKHAFEVELPSGLIVIGSKDDDGVAPFDFRIYSSSPEYNLVYSLNSRDDYVVARDVERLWAIARREIEGVDRTLDGILSDLDNEPPF